MKKIIILIIILLLITLLIYFLYKKHKQENNKLNKYINAKVDYDKLIKIYYSRSGDMNGNTDEIEFDFNNKTIITKYSPMHSDPIETKKYKLKDEDIKTIKEYIKKYNFPAWSKMPTDSELYPLDAACRVLTFIYDNSNIGGNKFNDYSIDIHTTIFPDNGIEIINDFTKELISIIEK